MLMEFDKADWPVEDKEWLKNRKAQWKALEPKLLVIGKKRKSLPFLRDFFIYGELDPDRYFESNRDALGGPFMLMFLHPNQSYEQLKAFYDSCGEEWSQMDNLRRVYESFYDAGVRAAQGDVYTELGKEGLFEGRDGLYARVFYGDRCGPWEQTDQHGKKLPTIMPECMFGSYLGYATFFMVGITQYPYIRERYMAEFWYSSIPYNKYPFAEVNAKRGVMRHLPMFLQAIYYFDDYVVEDGLSARRELADELRTILDTRPLPAELAELWEKTKQRELVNFKELNQFRKEYLGTSRCPVGYI